MFQLADFPVLLSGYAAMLPLLGLNFSLFLLRRALRFLRSATTAQGTAAPHSSILLTVLAVLTVGSALLYLLAPPVLLLYIHILRNDGAASAAFLNAIIPAGIVVAFLCAVLWFAVSLLLVPLLLRILKSPAASFIDRLDYGLGTALCLLPSLLVLALMMCHFT